MADVNEEEGTQDDLRGQHVTGHVLDMSAGGLSALTDQSVPTGAKMCVDSTCTQPFHFGGILCIRDTGIRCKQFVRAGIVLRPTATRTRARTNASHLQFSNQEFVSPRRSLVNR